MRIHEADEGHLMSKQGLTPTGHVSYGIGMRTMLAEPEVVTRKGKPVSVILAIKDYEELLERVEDAGDMAWLKRARKSPLHYRPLEDYLKERKRR